MAFLLPNVFHEKKNIIIGLITLREKHPHDHGAWDYTYILHLSSRCRISVTRQSSYITAVSLSIFHSSFWFPIRCFRFRYIFSNFDCQPPCNQTETTRWDWILLWIIDPLDLFRGNLKVVLSADWAMPEDGSVKEIYNQKVDSCFAAAFDVSQMGSFIRIYGI